MTLFLIKRDVRKLKKIINYKPIGQKISCNDPYGEENWNE